MLLLSIGVVLVLLSVMLAILSIPMGGGGVALVALAMGVLGAVLFWMNLRRLRSGATKSATQLIGGRVGDYLCNITDSRQCEATRYEVLYQTPVKGKNGRPSSLTVRVPAVTPIMQLGAENWFDRLCKHIGIAREHQTGDAEFDRAVYVRGPSDQRMGQYLEDRQKRAAVLILKTHGFQNVRLTGQMAEAIWSGFDPLNNDRPGLMAEASQALSVLDENLPRNDRERTEETAFAGSDRHGTWHARLWVLVIAFATLLALAFWYPPIRWTELWVRAVPILLVTYILFAWVAAFLLSGRSTSHDRWGRLMLAGLLSIPLGSAGGLAAVNALADQSPPQVRNITVSNKRTSKSRYSTSYYVTVSAWDGAGDTCDFKVSSEEYQSIVPGRSQLELTTGMGRMGIEWVKEQRIHPMTKDERAAMALRFCRADTRSSD